MELRWHIVVAASGLFSACDLRSAVVACVADTFSAAAEWVCSDWPTETTDPTAAAAVGQLAEVAAAVVVLTTFEAVVVHVVSVAIEKDEWAPA